MVTGKLEALGGLFLPQPDGVNGRFFPDAIGQTGAIATKEQTLSKEISHNETDWFVHKAC
jgi:hypothetical protein